MSWPLLTPGWLAAQAFSPGREAYRPEAATSPLHDPSWSDSTRPSSAFPVAEHGRVRQTAHETPSSPDKVSKHQELLSGSVAPAAQPVMPAPTVPMTPAGSHAPLKLSPPGHAQTGRAIQPSNRFGSLVTIGSSLAIVVGLFFVFAWIIRRTMPATAAPLPNEVVQVLGRTIVGHRQQLQLLRLGNRLLLISVTPGGAETLAEITDPDEVTHLAGLCLQTRSGSTTAAFRQVLEQLAGERTHGR